MSRQRKSPELLRDDGTGGPPAYPVTWKISRRDDPTISTTAVAQTAFAAYRLSTPELRNQRGESPDFHGVEVEIIDDTPPKKKVPPKKRPPAKKKAPVKKKRPTRRKV